MNRLTEVKIVFVATMVLGPVCGWLALKAIEFFSEDEPRTHTDEAITCPVGADLVLPLDPSIHAPGIGITGSGTICEFR